MKNRRNIIIAFLLCATLIVGVGYAALSDVMDISGTTTYNQNNALDALVYFQNPNKSHEANNIQIVNGNVDKVSFNVNSLATVNDYTYFWVELCNDSSQDISISFKEYIANEDAKTYYEFGYFIGTLTNGTVDDVKTLHEYPQDDRKFTIVKHADTFNETTHAEIKLEKNNKVFVCVQVKLTGDTTNGNTMPNDKTVSAAFNFEINVTEWVDNIGG